MVQNSILRLLSHTLLFESARAAEREAKLKAEQEESKKETETEGDPKNNAAKQNRTP